MSRLSSKPMIATMLWAAGALLSPTNPDEIRQLELRVLGAAQRGDIPEAQALLLQVPANAFPAQKAAWRQCMLERFDRKGEADIKDAPFTAAVLAAYRTYWEKALVSPRAIDDPEKELTSRLAQLSGDPASDPTTMEATISERMAAEGYTGLFGRTLPLLEFMAWRTKETVRHKIDLPEGPQSIDVFFLDDFASMGWTHYATCGRSASGGWTKPEGIYSIRGWQGDLEGESFRVSLLAHEAQHHFDRRYADVIESWELEYRAKLVEIILAEESLSHRLNHFSSGIGDEKSSPHAYANNRVIGGLLSRTNARNAGELGSLRAEELASVARKLLEESTQRLDWALSAKGSP